MKHLDKQQQLNQFFLPDLCNTRAIIILLAVSEALVLAMTLIEGSLTNVSWERFSLVSFFVLWVCLLSIAIICPLRNLIVRFSPLPASIVSLSVIGAVTLLVSVIGDRLWADEIIPIDWLWALRNLLISLIFGGMALRYFYVQSQWRVKTQAELRARLAALQASIRPHFFFNTLNTVASLIMVDPEKAETMLLDLSQLFRVVLNTAETLIPLQDEIELGRRYLDIEQTRLGESRLQIRWQLPKKLPSIQVPQLLLQPLLENSIYHGIQPSLENGYVEITLEQQGDYWTLIVRNSKTAQTKAPGHGIAQENIQARLTMLAKKAKLAVKETDKEYIAIVKIPMETDA